MNKWASYFVVPSLISMNDGFSIYLYKIKRWWSEERVIKSHNAKKEEKLIFQMLFVYGECSSTIHRS